MEFRPHRAALKSGTADVQKLFVMLKLRPEGAVAAARPPLGIAFLIDTSGSMRERVAGEETDAGNKLERAMQAAATLVDDPRLQADDQVSVIHFDTSASTLLPLAAVGDRSAAHHAIDELQRHHGGTNMPAGLQEGLGQLGAVPREHAKRAILLTDGKTINERKCVELADNYRQANIPIVALGVGDEYNADLLREVAARSTGRPYHLEQMAQLRAILNDELGTSVREVVTGVEGRLGLVRGVTLDAITRVYPSLAEIAVPDQPFLLGNVAARDDTVFIFDLSIAGLSRPPSRVRVAQLTLTGNAPGLDQTLEFAPLDMFVQFTPDEAAVAAVDPEVLSYVQQKNVDRMVDQAMRQSTKNAGQARQTLQVAAGMTQRLGNVAMTRMLNNALDELNRKGTISAGTMRTVQVGGRTRTVKVGGTSAVSGLSDDEIRRVTGT